MKPVPHISAVVVDSPDDPGHLAVRITVDDGESRPVEVTLSPGPAGMLAGVIMGAAERAERGER